MFVCRGTKNTFLQCFGTKCINKCVRVYIIRFLIEYINSVRLELLFIATDATLLIRELSFQHVHFNLRSCNMISIPCYHGSFVRNVFEIKTVSLSFRLCVVYVCFDLLRFKNAVWRVKSLLTVGNISRLRIIWDKKIDRKEKKRKHLQCHWIQPVLVFVAHSADCFTIRI